MSKYASFLLVNLLVALFSSASLAVNPQIISVSNTMFPGAALSHYTNAQSQLAAKAQEFCGEFNESVEKISNITIQVLGDFQLKGQEQIISTNHPHTVATALVNCTSAK